jgi:hypothetical protein
MQRLVIRKSDGVVVGQDDDNPSPVAVDPILYDEITSVTPLVPPGVRSENYKRDGVGNIVPRSVAELQAAFPQEYLTSLYVDQADGLVKTKVGTSGTPTPLVPTVESVIKLTADRNSTVVTFADITGLSFPVAVSTNYVFEATIIFRSVATTTGIALAANGPASPVSFTMQRRIATSLTAATLGMARAYNSGAASADVDIANVDMIAHLSGVLRNGLNAGTFILRFASEVATSQVTIKAGSVLRWKKI